MKPEKLLRFKKGKNIFYGSIAGGKIRVLRGNVFGKIFPTAQIFDFKAIKILPPVEPSKIICVGLNYCDHARELNMAIPKEPIIFLKPPTAIIAHLGKIKYPVGVKRLDFEAELAIVIKKKCKNIRGPKVKEVILGFTCFNDITARDLQQKDGQWTRAKSFDNFAPFGPVIATNINPDNLNIKLYLNNKLKQASNTKNFIFNIPTVVSFISKIMTLMPGDIIATGTPPGVGPMQRGDKVTVEIEQIGSLTNYVR